MSHVPHELSEMMPEHAEAMNAMKGSNSHFDRLAEKYHDLNREIHRAETDVAPTDDFHMNELRRKRLALLDEIRGLLTA